MEVIRETATCNCAQWVPHHPVLAEGDHRGPPPRKLEGKMIGRERVVEGPEERPGMYWGWGGSSTSILALGSLILLASFKVRGHDPFCHWGPRRAPLKVDTNLLEYYVLTAVKGLCDSPLRRPRPA